jgi:hypothetical protein
MADVRNGPIAARSAWNNLRDSPFIAPHYASNPHKSKTFGMLNGGWQIE